MSAGDALVDSGQPSPLTALLRDLSEGAAPQRRWIEEHCPNGAVDLARLWAAERDACVLLQVLRLVDHAAAVLGACACARTVLRLVPARENRPRRAVEIAEAWCRGEAADEDVAIAAAAAEEATADDFTGNAAINAAYAAAWSVRHPVNVGEAAAEAAAATAGDFDDERLALAAWMESAATARAHLADVVRSVVGAPDLLAIGKPPRD